ncbi:flagellar basal body L-ring protein FlgH [Limnohabitans sp.]|uniref:flagellar basal body L-ring protein FlgH n=1 Tax=Limnohabitans sp. TaxID=1907725 RepID=UPI0038BDE9E4
MNTLRSLSALALVALLQACATDNTELVLKPSPEFAPVYPLASERPKVATGGIYSNRQSDAWFGRGRNYQVGDIITVLLNESTQAARTQNSEINRDSKNTLPTGFSTQIGKMSPFLNGIDLNNNAIDSKSKGQADQQASLVGSVAVTVVEILANGNLVIRGEKKLGLAEGTEVIQVTGVIRPEDVGPNSTVQSRRLANAQIAYRGTGDLANASRVGWGTGLMHKLWPF